MLSNAFALALVTTGGFYIVYNKLPRKVRRFLQKNSLLTDLASLVAVYTIMGGTLTALMAGALCGLFVSVLLHVANNPGDFLYLYDMRDIMKDKMKVLKGTLNNYGQRYRANKIRESHLSEVQSA